MNRTFTIWFTGLSGAGKSTLAIETANFLEKHGHTVQILDGDIIRKGIGNIFGYSKEERMKMSRVIRLICKILNNNGITVIVAAIAPFQEMRDINRSDIDNYIEVYVDCPIEICIKRDVKGLYRQALNGDMKHVVGIDDPFEIPKSPDVVVNTDKETIEESVKVIVDCLSQGLF